MLDYACAVLECLTKTSNRGLMDVLNYLSKEFKFSENGKKLK